MPREISMPFNIGEDGQVDTTSDPDGQVRQHVLSLVNTSYTERVMLPNYGVDAQSLIFENMDPNEVSVLTARYVEESFATWEPGVEMISVVPHVGPEGEVSVVDVEYQRRDAPDSNQSSNTNTAIIGADGTVKDIIRG